MDCILNLKDIQFETRDKQVFFASNDIIVYKEQSTIVMTNCDGEEITFCPCPRDSRHFEVIDLGDSILLALSGKSIVVLDKMGNTPIQYDLNITRFGRIITKLYPVGEDSIMFGTKRGEHVQVVNYDFIGQKRIAQSASWKVRNITDMMIQGDKAYALLDSSFLVGCSTETCETLWNRFEAGYVNPYLIPHDGGILYSCQGLIRHYKNGSINTIQVPLSRVSSLLTCLGDKLIFTSDDHTNIGSYDLTKNRLVWEVVGSEKILEFVMVKGKVDKETFNTVAIRVDDKFGLVNVDLGRSAYYGKCYGVYRIRQTSDHLLLHKSKGQTDMITGLSDVG